MKDDSVLLAYPAFYESVVRWLDFPVKVVKNFDDVKSAKLVIFTGGEDIDPRYYNEPSRFSDSNPTRDDWEYRVFKNMPKSAKILGICRGLQVINVFEGGSLYQDLYHETGKAHNFEHELKIEVRGSLVDKYFRGRLVNSMHHQGIKHNPTKLSNVTATHKDLIEAIETPSTILVQFHPELMSNDYAKDFGQAILNWSEVK